MNRLIHTCVFTVLVFLACWAAQQAGWWSTPAVISTAAIAVLEFVEIVRAM